MFFDSFNGKCQMKYARYTLIAILMTFLFSGCFLANTSPAYERHATKYLKSHSDMTMQEINNFVWKGNIEQRRLLELAKSPSYQVRVLVSKNRNLPIEYLETMLEDKSWEVVRACSWNTNFTTQMFEKMIYHKNVNVRYYVANHERLPIEDLIVLSNDESSLVRGQAARNPRLPEAEIRRLFLEEARWVKAGLAGNEKVPIDVLLALSEVKDPLVRKEVATNPNLPEKDIRKLFAEKKPEILYLSTRRGLVENPNTPKEILIELSTDKKDYIRHMALQRLNKY